MLGVNPTTQTQTQTVLSKRPSDYDMGLSAPHETVRCVFYHHSVAIETVGMLMNMM